MAVTAPLLFIYCYKVIFSKPTQYQSFLRNLEYTVYVHLIS